MAIQHEANRDSALITFLATASGMSFLGISSVFWGICIGVAAHLILTKRNPIRIDAVAAEQCSKN